MKNLLILAAALLCGSAIAQTAPNDSLRSFKLKVVDKKGRPMKNYQLVFRVGTPASRLWDLGPKGFTVVDGVKNADSLYFFAPGYAGKFAIAGLDSALITIRGRQLPTITNGDRLIETGFGSLTASKNTMAVNEVPVDENSLSGYTDLASYLEGRVPGLRVERRYGVTQVIIRGVNTFSEGTQSALIVIDNVQYTDFDTVNRILNVRDIKSINVLKESSLYGVFGANGVVVITTKSGSAGKK